MATSGALLIAMWAWRVVRLPAVLGLVVITPPFVLVSLALTLAVGLVIIAVKAALALAVFAIQRLTNRSHDRRSRVADSLRRPGTPEGDLSRKVSNRAGLLFALVSLECSVEGGAVDVEHLGEVVEVHAGVE